MTYSFRMCGVGGWGMGVALVGVLTVVGESLRVEQRLMCRVRTWSKTVGVQEGALVCGCWSSRAAVCCAPRAPCDEMWCARGTGSRVPAASTPPARPPLRYLGGRAGCRAAAHGPICVVPVQCLSHTSRPRRWCTGWHLFCDMRYRNG